MDFGLIVIAGVILYFCIEIYGTIMIAKQLKENKARTGRYSIPWSNLGPIRKGLLIALPCILIGLFIWLYFFSIFAPGPGELYNTEIVAIGLLFALTLIANIWMVRN